MKRNVLKLMLISLVGLTACTDKLRQRDDQVFWKLQDSLDFNFNYADRLDTLKKLLKTEQARKAVELMGEIEWVDFKYDSTGNLVFSDSAKTIYQYDNDSTKKKLENFSNQYPADYLPRMVWAKFYSRVSDFKNVEKSLLEAKAMSNDAGIDVLLGDNVTWLQSTLFQRALKDTLGNLKDSAAYNKADNRLSKQQHDFYNTAVKKDSTLYSGLVRLAEKLNTFGEDGKGKQSKKITRRIKELIQKAIALRPRWPKAYSSLQYLKNNISRLEYEQIYAKQIELGDSSVLSTLASQKKSYNLPEAARLVKLYNKFQYADKSGVAIDLASVYFTQAEIDRADSVLLKRIQIIKKDTVSFFSPDELANLYKTRAYYHRLYGRYPKALSLIDSCIKLDTTYNQQYVIEKAMILLRMKRQPESNAMLTAYLSTVSRKYARADTAELSIRKTPVENFQVYYNMKK